MQLQTYRCTNKRQYGIKKQSLKDIIWFAILNYEIKLPIISRYYSVGSSIHDKIHTHVWKPQLTTDDMHVAISSVGH